MKNEKIFSNHKSEILNDTASFELINKRLNLNNKNISFNLIYKLNEKNNSASKFHELCDGKRNVLVLIKTIKNVRFGGFISVGFDSYLISLWINLGLAIAA